MYCRKVAGDQARVGQMSNANCGVKTLLNQIDGAVVQHHVDRDFAVTGHVIGDNRCQVGETERDRRRDPENTPGPYLQGARVAFDLVDLFENSRISLMNDGTDLRQTKPARVAVEQTGTE